MTDSWNTGSAILIVGSLYLKFAFGLDQWVAAALCALGIVTWGYVAHGKERFRILKAQARIAEAKAAYWEKRATGTLSG